MIPALALAVGIAPQGDCGPREHGWVCWEGAVQLVAAARPDGEGAALRRFALLADWPRGQFDRVWAGDHLGWEARVSDGERAQVTRWWEADGVLYVVSVVGPEAAVGRLAPGWLAGVRFPGLEEAVPSG